MPKITLRRQTAKRWVEIKIFLFFHPGPTLVLFETALPADMRWRNGNTAGIAPVKVNIGSGYRNAAGISNTI